MYHCNSRNFLTLSTASSQLTGIVLEIPEYLTPFSHWTSSNTLRLEVTGTIQISINGCTEGSRLYLILASTQNKPTFLVYRVSFANPYLPGSGTTETVMNATGKAQRAEAVKWRDTCCTKILRTTQSDASYYHGKSLVTSMGEQVGLDSHVIFQRSGKMSIGRICEILISPGTSTTVEQVALQHFSFGPTCSQQCICQERIETAQTKAVVEHQANSTLFPEHLPEMLRETPLRVTNSAEVRTMAVQQMKDKKAAKKAGEVPPSQEANTVEEGARGATAPAPAFDQAPTKSRAATKSRGKASAST
ncbi:hypothetical protein F4604DRAFT_1680746 [Suillus subluteus]|nr:hypothetical protein F4604DRAFT_1680746 [Suillus subluteus]